MPKDVEETLLVVVALLLLLLLLLLKGFLGSVKTRRASRRSQVTSLGPHLSLQRCSSQGDEPGWSSSANLEAF
ncbi:hypothetical protein GUITHDRAFT_156172 [Guillardia theta CCMP2712]|uniref:Uncharacterized protein n=1 Tax=Guillardia theta (strain CCMP2712) TaxID=905079 RepID=L1IAA9_GUITC|nr:hypothetical protein GUITHDRAFT_156172 [Guillardia theta CCMP2712]EKX33047.1 hypothetical protein GUITHDRAFT_156172 [Guillardia theta CCMP2712]|eukprot:XP_005820027.1 hypothetical protein GUITHDRAFT_156172 [Guillardia theta CCMP2712]